MVQRKPDISIIKHIDTAALGWCGAAALVGVEGGRGALRQTVSDDPHDGSGGTAAMALTLNGQPLAHGRMPDCPTCMGMLAAGYGVGNMDSAELKSVGARLNEEIGDIAAAVDALSPLLGLLEDGLYMVADVPHCPTDGGGRFFWDVPPGLAAYPATAMALSYDGSFTEGVPSFLYPSQHANRYDEARVRHYMERYRQGARPVAAAYHLREFMSVLLDGHHKAAAAALLGMRVPCLTVIPLTSVVFEPPYTPKRWVVQELNFAGIRADGIPPAWQKRAARGLGRARRAAIPATAGVLPRVWEPRFAQAARKYPTAAQSGMATALVPDDITEAEIESRLGDPSGDGADWLAAALTALAAAGDKRLKPLALRCAQPGRPADLRAEAFRILAATAGDADAERVFLDYLVEENHPRSVLRRIAERYFED